MDKLYLNDDDRSNVDMLRIITCETKSKFQLIIGVFSIATAMSVIEKFTEFPNTLPMNTNSVADSEGGPPLGKPKNVKGPHFREMNGTYPPPTEWRRPFEITEKFCYYPPPTEWRRLSEMTEKFCYYPPTESRRLGAAHERGRLLRKIVDLRLELRYIYMPDSLR